MPLDKFVLLLVLVIAAAGATIWLAAMLAATVSFPGLGLAVFIPVALVGYVLWRVLSDRLSSREDDHYDKIDR